VVSLMHLLEAQHQQVVKSQTDGTALSQYSLLDPKLVGGAPHSYTRLHRQQWQLIVALSVMPFCRTATNDHRVNHFSLNRLSRSETIARWGRSAPQHPPARCARVSLPVTSSTSDDTTYNNGSQNDSSASHHLQQISYF
jgi:hypothetical protein